jgi:hypothetical protein
MRLRQARTVVMSLVYRLVSRVLDLVLVHRMTEAEKDIEILVLRHQLEVFTPVGDVMTERGLRCG